MGSSAGCSSIGRQRRRTEGRPVDGAGETGEPGVLEHRADRQFHPELRAHAGGQLGGEQRVAAEGEEVVAPADAVALEQRRPQPGQQLLGGRGGGLEAFLLAAASGAGRAWRSTLPLGVSGRRSSTWRWAGTMYPGRRAFRKVASCVGRVASEAATWASDSVFCPLATNHWSLATT